jgi:RHS repeat-associated protein
MTSDQCFGYRFGFNGMEMDNEVQGQGNAYDFGARIYDSRLGRWMSLDAKAKAYQSNYAFARNCPITWIDPDGNDDYFYDMENKSWSFTRTENPNRVFVQTWEPVSEGAILQNEVLTQISADGVQELIYTHTGLYKHMMHHATAQEQIEILDSRRERFNEDGIKVMIGTLAIPIVVIAAAEIGSVMYATAAGKTALINAGINAGSQTIAAGGDINKVDWADVAISGATSALLPGGDKLINWGGIVVDAGLSAAIDVKFTGISHIGNGSKSGIDFTFDFGAGVVTGFAGDLTSAGVDKLVEGLGEKVTGESARAAFKAAKPYLKNMLKKSLNHGEGEGVGKAKDKVKESTQ